MIQERSTKNATPRATHAGPWLRPSRDRLSRQAHRWLTLGLVTIVAAGGCAAVERHTARQHVRSGEALMASEQYDAALAKFEAAAALDKASAIPLSRMGAIYRTLGEYERAADSLVEAIRRDPFSFADTFSLAQVYKLLHRVSDAIQAYAHAVRLDPKSFDARINLGVCHQEVGDYAQAVEAFQDAIEIDPERAHGYVNLGVALSAQERYYDAIRAYREALERDTEQPMVLVNLARTYLKQDRLRMARNSLTQAIKMAPELAAAYEAMGYCLFKMRSFDDAERSYQQALAYDWRLPRAHAGLASINMLAYLRDNDRAERQRRALEHWHRSLELDPDQPKIRKLLARFTPKSTDPEEVLLSASGQP